MKEKVVDILAKHLNLKKEEIESKIEIPPSSELGDYAFPCFILASKLKKNPASIAKELVGKIAKSLPKEIEKVIDVSGYVNFFINKNILAELVLENVLKEKENFGKQDIGKNKKIVIDFSGPNIGKPMHIGHIRSTVLGDSLLRIYNFCGYDTKGINYLGDIGLHIGKLIVAYELWLNKASLKKNSVDELLRLYVKFCDKEKTEYQEGIEEEFQTNEWTNKAKEKLRLLEDGDKKTHEIWKEIIRYSKEGFNRIYEMLNVNFHETTGQSLFSEYGRRIIIEALKKGIAKTEDDGAVYVEFDDLPKKYILRSNGTASYITQDIGAAVERYKKYTFDKMIYVTDFRQELHFKHLFEILKKIGYPFAKKLLHVGFGTVNFGKEIIASRKGKIILLEDVLKKTIEKAKYEIKKRGTKGDAEKIGVGSIKYAILKNDSKRDVNFSWEQALSFEGNTGPYIQYTYARASSILRKSKDKTNKKTSNKSEFEKEEISLIKKVNEFPDVVAKASEQLNPSLIANYCFELSQLFNEFYHNCPVIGNEKESLRIKIVKITRQTIGNCLNLLGIDTMEEM